MRRFSLPVALGRSCGSLHQLLVKRGFWGRRPSAACRAPAAALAASVGPRRADKGGVVFAAAGACWFLLGDGTTPLRNPFRRGEGEGPSLRHCPCPKQGVHPPGGEGWGGGMRRTANPWPILAGTVGAPGLPLSCKFQGLGCAKSRNLLSLPQGGEALWHGGASVRRLLRGTPVHHALSPLAGEKTISWA